MALQVVQQQQQLVALPQAVQQVLVVLLVVACLSSCKPHWPACSAICQEALQQV
jgi:hypothetical protein